MTCASGSIRRLLWTRRSGSGSLCEPLDDDAIVTGGRQACRRAWRRACGGACVLVRTGWRVTGLRGARASGRTRHAGRRRCDDDRIHALLLRVDDAMVLEHATRKLTAGYTSCHSRRRGPQGNEHLRHPLAIALPTSG